MMCLMFNKSAIIKKRKGLGVTLTVIELILVHYIMNNKRIKEIFWVKKYFVTQNTVMYWYLIMQVFSRSIFFSPSVTFHVSSGAKWVLADCNGVSYNII